MKRIHLVSGNDYLESLCLQARNKVRDGIRNDHHLLATGLQFLQRKSHIKTSATTHACNHFLTAEPLSRLKPGGSGRDHRPLCAALAT
jgi:hypothetical protein